MIFNITLLVMFFWFFASYVLAFQPDNKMIDYTISWQQANSHLFEITIETPSLGQETIDFALPNWRPGRYLIQNYARNVQEFSVSNDKGQLLDWEKIDKSTWRIQTGKASIVKIYYKYYANILDAGSSLLDDKEAYFNGTNLFMYQVNRRLEKCRLKILTPENWLIATALKKESQNVFLANSYDELADSPVIASPSLKTQEFTYANTTYHIVFQGKLDYDINTIADNLRKIVEQQVKLFGGTAPFEHYWFLYHIGNNTTWHGVEHSYSTSITMPANAFALERSRQNFYSISSHELFHAWNVKRIMPSVFLNPDYSREAYTRLLWFFEGVTSYYGELSLRRAEIIDEKVYLAGIEKNISDLQNAPGRLITSVEDASFNDWLQPDDRENTRISFYNKGEVLGLLLDLEIRRRTDNAKSLDDVIRYLYQNYAMENQGVPENGILLAVETVSGTDFKKFFSQFISGCDELLYDQVLAIAGLSLQVETDKSRPEAYLGIKLSPDERAIILNVTPNSPAMIGGLSKGDVLLAINDNQVNLANLSETLMGYAPNAKVTLTVFRARQLRNFEVTLTNLGNTYYQLKSLANKSEVQQRVFTSWLSSLK